jgi:hypothetical protein
MAELYNIQDISYDIQRNPEWFSKALFSGNIIERGLVRILPNVKKSMKLNEINITDWVLVSDDDQCGFNPDGDKIKLSESILDVNTFKINLKSCLKIWETVWLESKLKPGARLEELPDTLEAHTLDLIAAQINDQIETLLFRGDKNNTNEFDGIVKFLTDAADTVKVAGSNLTKANVASEIEKVYQVIPEAVLQKGEDKIKIFTSYNTLRALRMALSNINSQVVRTEFSIDNNVIHFLGLEIVPSKGLNNSQMVASDTQNLVFGTDLISDFSNVELGQYPKPDEDQIFIKGRMRMGTSVLYPGEVVLYAPNVGSEKNKGGK